MIRLEQRQQGIVFQVKAQPAARKNEVRGEHDGALKVSVTQVAEKGKANKAIIDLLAKALKLKKSQLTLIAGETSSQKHFLVDGISAEELQTRIERLLKIGQESK